MILPLQMINNRNLDSIILKTSRKNLVNRLYWMMSVFTKSIIEKAKAHAKMPMALFKVAKSFKAS